MKKLILLLIIAAFSATGRAQTGYQYDFRNNLHERTTGPALIATCQDSFMSDVLTDYALTRPVYRFQHGCGLNFDDATHNFLATSSYTIEMYVALDTVTSYRKLIDYANLSSDGGLYMLDSALDFYSGHNTNSALYPDGKYRFTVITRNGATQGVKM